MRLGDESDIISEFETQFVAQSGDEDVLWEVEEITAERGKKYKVKWAGIDPATGKRWAQSWVAKHDCTDDLVIEWKAKKKRLAAGKKGGRRTSTVSGTSGASKRAGSSTSGSKTRRSTSKATSSRLDAVEEHLSPPPKSSTTTKRKRQAETPVEAATTSGSAVQANEQGESSSRPRKKQRTVVEVLLPPISSDDEGHVLLVPRARITTTARNKEVPLKRSGVVSDEDGGSPPKAKNMSERRPDARAKGTAVGSGGSGARDESRSSHSKAKAKVASRSDGRTITSTLVLSSESDDESLRPPKQKKKPTSTCKSPPPLPPQQDRQNDDAVQEKEAGSTALPIKIGPPRGVKRGGKSKEPRLPSKPGPSVTTPQEDGCADEHVPTGQPIGCLDHGVPSFDEPVLPPQKTDTVDTRASPSPHISIPQVPMNPRSRSPDLSPGATARLELFDRMMADNPTPLDVPEQVPDDTHLDFNNIHDVHDTFNTFDAPPPPSPLPSEPRPEPAKPGTSNGLVVPETESSGNSQSQLQPLHKPPSPLPQPPRAPDQSSHKPIDLPTIAVVAGPGKPQDPPLKVPAPTNRPSRWPTFKVAPSTLHSTTDARSRVDDSEAPPSSIESFTSPMRTDKRKQTYAENGQLRSSPSEGEEDDAPQRKRVQIKITDSHLKKRGQELFDQAQLAREAESQKSKKPKRLKAVDDIVNGLASSPSKGLPLPSTATAGRTVEMRGEDVVDSSGGANNTTLDTPEHSEVKPLSEEERERLRVELRQEEEENTQEAMGAYPPPPVKESEVTNGGDAPSPSKNHSPLNGQTEDGDHVEQPSTDLHKASVIVQPSQEQRHEEVDMESLPVNPPPSSPPRPVPENLTNSPRRRLGEALSLLNVKSEEIQRLERELADERKITQGLRAELVELQQSSEPTGPVRAAWEAERAQWAQERSKWEKDLALWETQRKEMSEENVDLSARLAELSDAAARAEEARVKVSELETAREAWTKERDAMLSDKAQCSEELAAFTDARQKHNQDLSKWEAEKNSWAEERAKWETERAALQEKQESLTRSVDELTASVESLKATKVSAENDRDFFREQYTQASGFVGSVREENVELEKRVMIAEGQAQEGVAAIRALFEGRVKALQADVDRWKGLTELLQEKDRRTNDDLRLRAAQTPELVEFCGRLIEENKSLEADVRRLDATQRRNILQRNRLFYEILLLKKERASLRSKLSKLKKKADGGSQETPPSTQPTPPVVEDPESIDPNDMDVLPDPTPQSSDASLDELSLFPCMWRPHWRDQCMQIFDAKEDLERHMQEHFRDLQAR